MRKSPGNVPLAGVTGIEHDQVGEPVGVQIARTRFVAAVKRQLPNPLGIEASFAAPENLQRNGADRSAYFRCEDHSVAAIAECLADNLFGDAAGASKIPSISFVDVGRIETHGRHAIELDVLGDLVLAVRPEDLETNRLAAPFQAAGDCGSPLPRGVVVPANHRLLVVAPPVRTESHDDDADSPFHEPTSQQTLLPRSMQTVTLTNSFRLT